MLKVIKIVSGVLFALVTLISLYIYSSLKLSVPTLDGSINNPHINAKVSIKRDWRGIPLIKAETLADSIYTIGFLHGQERFFQMDMMRRNASGELAELFGSSALTNDKAVRIHRFRSKAEKAYNELPVEQREILDNYTKGVNEGLQKLNGIPYEYRLMFLSPEPWLAEDSILVNMAIYLLLQTPSSEHPEIINDKLSTIYSSDYVNFLMAAYSDWDVPVDGSLIQPASFIPAKKHLLAKGKANAKENDHHSQLTENQEHNPLNESSPGSNSWVVSAAFRSLGRAMVSNDMHLPIQIPNTWYALSMIYNHNGEVRQSTGLTIPGLPVMAAGSNGAISWGLTNVNGDWSDLVSLEILDGNHYQTAEGLKAIEKFEEQIHVRGEETVSFEVQETRWGPVIYSNDEKLPYALNWVAHYPSANNLNAVGLITSKTLDSALEIAASSGMAHTNIVLADSSGNTAWTVMGRLPKRTGFDGVRSQPWDHNDQYWDGWLTKAEYPTLLSEKYDAIWTANNRVVGGEAAKTIGLGARYSLGARAMRIRDSLRSMNKVDEQVMHALQLDTVDVLLPRWQTLMIATLEGIEDLNIRQKIYPHIIHWNGTADKDSAGYRMLRTFRIKVAERIMKILTADALKQYPSLKWYDVSLQWESPLWAAVEARSEDALPSEFDTWEEFLEYLITDDIYPFYNNLDNGDIANATWGSVNRFHPQHPLSKIFPLGWLLDLPSEEVSGDKNVPIAQFGNFGASMRMVVSPNQENNGLLTMPVGQAANPLTPYFGAGHQQWIEGKSLPLLPQDAKYKLVLQPGS